MATQMSELEAVRKAMMEGGYRVALAAKELNFTNEEKFRFDITKPTYNVTMYSFSDTDNQTVVSNTFQTSNEDKLMAALGKADKPGHREPMVGFALFRYSPTLTDIF